MQKSSTDSHTNVRSQCGILLFFVPFALALITSPGIRAATVNVNCNTGGAVGRIVNRLKAGDAVLVQGTCQENILIPAQLQPSPSMGGATRRSRRRIQRRDQRGCFRNLRSPSPSNDFLQILALQQEFLMTRPLTYASRRAASDSA